MTLQEYIRKYCKYPNTLTEAEFKASGLPRMGGRWLEKCRFTQVDEEAMRKAVASGAASQQKRHGSRPENKRPKSQVRTNTAVLAAVAVFQVPAKKKKKRQFLPDSVKFNGDVNSDDFLLSFEWRRVRFLALQKYGRRCQCCGAEPSSGAVLNVDHVKSRRKYPHLALSLSNLQVLCADCNHGKGNMDTDFRN